MDNNQLTGTDCNLRVSECKTAVWIIEAYEVLPLKELEDTRLRDVDETVFLSYEHKMPECFACRARHFYTECDRVRLGMEASMYLRVVRVPSIIMSAILRS